MFFFAIIRFRASANISLKFFLNIYLFWILDLSQKNLLYLSSWFFLLSIASSIKFSLLQLILYLKEYVLLCYAIFEINIVKNNWQTHLFKHFLLMILCTNKCTLYIYRILSWLVPITINIFPNSWEDWTKVIFLFSKILQLMNQKSNWRVARLLWHRP